MCIRDRRDTLSAAIYPAVFDDYVRKVNLHGPLTMLPTKAFLVGLDIDEECEVELRAGVCAFSRRRGASLLEVGRNSRRSHNANDFS